MHTVEIKEFSSILIGMCEYGCFFIYLRVCFESLDLEVFIG